MASEKCSTADECPKGNLIEGPIIEQEDPAVPIPTEEKPGNDKPGLVQDKYAGMDRKERRRAIQREARKKDDGKGENSAKRKRRIRQKLKKQMSIELKRRGITKDQQIQIQN